MSLQLKGHTSVRHIQLLHRPCWDTAYINTHNIRNILVTMFSMGQYEGKARGDCRDVVSKQFDLLLD